MFYTLCKIDDDGAAVVKRDLTPTAAFILRDRLNREHRAAGKSGGYFVINPNGKLCK
jgi:hypothetical protein